MLTDLLFTIIAAINRDYFMKRYILSTIAIAFFLSVQGQVLPKDTTLSTYTNQTSIQALNSITLKNGFHIPVQSGRTVTINISGFQNLVSKPSVDRNYIVTKIFRKAGVTLATLNSDRTIGDENQTIEYVDGLGRPLQTIQLMASPTYKDIVQHIEYDGFGREATKYLPYVHSEGNGSYKTGGNVAVVDFYNKSTGTDIVGIVRTEKPFAVTVFENSPLNRVTEQGAPGADWQPLASAGAGHTIKTLYGTNTATGINIVKLWKVEASGASSIANYDAGKLYLTTIRDENTVNTTARSGSVDEYKDFGGRVVLKRIWETESKALNTYYVYDDFGDLRYVLPPAVTVSSFTEDLTADPNFDKYIYAYKYDDKRRLINKKVPGKGWEYLVYNKNDQIVFTRDAEQLKRNEWSFIKYDAFGRVVITGIEKGHEGDNHVYLQQALEDFDGLSWEERGNVMEGYTNNTIPQNTENITVLTVSYYDSYAGVPNIPFSNEASYSKKIKGLEIASKSKVLNGNDWLWNVSYYDDYGRVVNQSSTNHLHGKDVITNTYSFVGELETSTRVHTPKTGSATTIVSKNEYDHVGRLTATKERIGSQAEVILASNSYNEIGQLKATSVGRSATESAFVNTSSFTYNERGWLIGNISSKFSQQLKYQDGINPQWNGNVSQQLWGDEATLPNTFTYKYDKLNRLLSGISAPSGIASMSEVITYDELGMGNIKTLKRDALAVTTYTYNGNKLTGLTGGLTGAYTYDGNGNATKDRTGMTISYNYLNLPQSANKTGTSVIYLYDASGNKLQKKTTVGTVNSSRDYIDGIEYNNSDIDIIHNSVGYALKSGTNYVYHYNLTDHLGNVRATLKRGSSATAVDVTQRDNYYPFGKQKVVAGGNNKYLYNGKEIQGELGGQYDYGARFYDAEIGRWNVIDPLADKMRRYSPYNYAFNNPLRFIDPDGREADDKILLNQYGDEQRRIKESGLDEYYMEVNSGGDYKWISGNLSKSAIRVLSPESVKGDPRETPFTGVLNETFTKDVQKTMIDEATLNLENNSLINKYADIAKKSDKGGKLDFIDKFKAGELININGIYMNNHEALNYMWGASMSRIGVSLETSLFAADKYHQWDFLSGGRSKGLSNQRNHNEAIYRGYSRESGKDKQKDFSRSLLIRSASWKKYDK